MCGRGQRELLRERGQRSDVSEGVSRCCCLSAMACLMAAWSVHNPTVTNSIIMVSTGPDWSDWDSGLRVSVRDTDWTVVDTLETRFCW